MRGTCGLMLCLLTTMSESNRKQWDNSKDEMLIEAVKSKPELYDLASPLYSNVNIKRKSWGEVNRQLGCEGCKERWESLRSQFRKIMGKCTKSGQGASKYNS
ncbi:transcription factor Adf-1-like [Portunus trituberculatus]|uniref:transcription factor Adf-1-like n=1 Tax=Portunus trituberculatus TaxID=210409 RepID=UPI001E1D0276|nr:transcription factor Adf-1-like [Portunus trituberculatus]